MVGTSKILTVSYGTFSCTLEGFDDSFGTMKAIAEYFRGLAADDRYFGAEPPTPDADMLASIAEREISRRVDAHMDDGGIVLRAAALSDQSQDASSDDAPMHDAASRAEVEAARKAAKAERKAEKAKAKAEAKAAKDAAKAEAKAAREAEEAAAKAEEEAAAAEAAAEAEAAEDALASDGLASDEDGEEAASENSIQESVSAATADDAEGITGSEAEETRSDAMSSMLADEDPAPEYTAEDEGKVTDTRDAFVFSPKVPAHPDAESVAAKLQRIRAVVDHGDADDAPSDDLTVQFLPEAETLDVTDGQDDAEDDLVADFDAHEAEMEIEAEAEATPDTEATADQPRVKITRMKRADFDKAVADGQIDLGDAAPSNTAEDDAFDGPDFGLLDGAEELDEYLEDSDFTGNEGAETEDTDLAQNLADIQDDADTTVDAVSEAMAADGETEIEAEAVAEGETAAEDDQDTEGDDTSSFLSDEPQVDDAALDRLMDETDAQMQEPEGSRRRDAIAQLKAAVAAKEAARRIGEDDDNGDDVENAFRNDLSEAVGPDAVAAPRPRPAVRGETRTERPTPAPLKLVPAQRVDMEEAAARRETPVVPRRVAASAPDDAKERTASSFSEFAESMGATELSELLEAAAAYTAFVEGVDEFSRPQILRRVRSVASDDFKREDELRSFASLVSEGRFTKVRNGRFQVADDSRFNPERRAS